MALSAMGFVVLLYVYFTFFLGPLQRSRNTTLANIDELQKKIEKERTIGTLLRTEQIHAPEPHSAEKDGLTA